jgi:hypothetical protein
MHTFSVARAAAENKIVFSEIESFDGKGIKHEVMTEATIHRRQVLHHRGPDVRRT